MNPTTKALEQMEVEGVPAERPTGPKVHDISVDDKVATVATSKKEKVQYVTINGAHISHSVKKKQSKSCMCHSTLRRLPISAFRLKK